ncbi:hypothetical protein J6590_012709 [Homalodisca vitripennis]|nr:hypothetical protein J6590_012709 [Homalodisca vitripennis]
MLCFLNITGNVRDEDTAEAVCCFNRGNSRQGKHLRYNRRRKLRLSQVKGVMLPALVRLGRLGLSRKYSLNNVINRESHKLIQASYL